MATDTAFAVALIAVMGARVPVELRIFLTAAAIVDDIGAIIVVAIFYSDALNVAALLGALAAVGFLVVLNRSGVYRVTPYVLTGVLLWACVHAGGLHATLAGVLLAAFIPTRKPPDFQSLALQAEAILESEASHGGEQFEWTFRARTAASMKSTIASNLRGSPLRVAPRSSYLVLPSSLANAGVVIAAEVLGGRQADGGHLRIRHRQAGRVHPGVMACGRCGGKPAAYPAAIGRRGRARRYVIHLSLFIAGRRSPWRAILRPRNCVFAASVLSAIIGMVVLWGRARLGRRTHEHLYPRPNCGTHFARGACTSCTKPPSRHNLMCTYRTRRSACAAAPGGRIDPAEADATARWRRAILKVAVEEMGHLYLAVWNTAALGQAPLRP
jgi:NhaA family Na+:H+ antiporter